MKNMMTAMVAMMAFGCMTRITTPRARIFTTSRDPNKIVKSLEESPSLTRPIVPNANAYGALVTASDGNPDTLAAIHDVALPVVSTSVVNSATTISPNDNQPRLGAISNWKNQAYAIRAIDENGSVAGETLVEAHSSVGMKLTPGRYRIRIIDGNDQVVWEIDRTVPREFETRAFLDPVRNIRLKTNWVVEIN